MEKTTTLGLIPDLCRIEHVTIPTGSNWTKGHPVQISLYFHIPFCSAICHYCDFAKTANWDRSVTTEYFKILHEHTQIWVDWIVENKLKVPTVFFGGGTPGLFDEEYAPILKTIAPVLTETAEISLEANPQNIGLDRLQAWKHHGFNRLSLGVQSFQDQSLKFLHRDHNSSLAINALELARREFENVNIDLIYGIPDSSHTNWLEDLKQALKLNVSHLSLYNLTWEPQTVFGKRLARGVAKKSEEETDLWSYEIACEMLFEHGFEHEEVSNWSRPGSSCAHNWVYWRGGHYIGIGTGAHGYLPCDSEFGLRYSYPKNDRLMKRIVIRELEKIKLKKAIDYQPVMHQERDDEKNRISLDLRNANLLVEENRTHEDVFIEIIGSSLRTREGVPVEFLEQLVHKNFQIHPQLQNLIHENKLTMNQGHLVFHPEAWFMENFWAQKVIESFQP